MAQTQPVQFASQSYQARTGFANIERCLNLYLEVNPSGAKGPVTLYGTPGLKLFASVGDGPIRGIQALGNKLIVISGQEAYLVTGSGGITLIGVIEGTGDVLMNDNGIQVGVATSGGAGKAYSVDESTITELSQSNFNGATAQDGFGIFTQDLGQKMFITALDNMASINALDFTTADALPDNVVGCISDHREVWVFGDQSVEIYANVGTAAFPFVRTSSGFVERGCASKGSIAKEDNSVFWLGDDLAIYQAAGYQPKKISTPAIEILIKAATNPETTNSFTYRQAGHQFYVVNFTDLSIVYDISTGLWHERKSDGKDRWKANSHTFSFGKNIVGDFETGTLYELDLDTFTDNGSTIRRQAIAPPMHNGGSRMFMSEFFLDMETGVGLNSGQGSDPTIILDWSEDGGNTFSASMDRSAGAIGEYLHRATWNRLGSFRQRSMRMRISDPVKVAIIGSYARLRRGSA